VVGFFFCRAFCFEFQKSPYTLNKAAKSVCIEEIVIAELLRAKRASEETWVRKLCNPSSRENLSFVRPSAQTIGEGRGARCIPNGGAEESILSEICKEKENSFCLLSTNDSGG